MEGPKGGKVSSYGSCLSSSAGRKSRPRQIKFYIYICLLLIFPIELFCAGLLFLGEEFSKHRGNSSVRAPPFFFRMWKALWLFIQSVAVARLLPLAVQAAPFFTFPSSLFFLFFKKKIYSAGEKKKKISLLPRIDKSYRHGPRARVFLQSNPGIEGMVYGRKVL